MHWLAVLSLSTAALAADAADAPVPVKDAAARMTLPPGFRVSLFAGEPDVVQPMSFTFDDRGRMWVVECLSYPKWTSDGTGRDRVVILEDTDGDGRHDRKQVFLDRGVNLSSIEYGFGGVWLTSLPNLIFIPDRNGDDVPDGPPEVLLDGWDLKAKHNVVNSLAWGPDGWLYGCNGILSNSRIGRPGTPDAERAAINCGVWRYHPTRRVFEPYAWGTTNPWGLDWDDYGQPFITNCVIKHLFHVMPGAHYERMFGQDLNPHVFQLLPSCADHIHWAGGAWESSRGGQGAHSDAGGGHAHSGCAVYLGDNFPPEYRNNVFTCNIHGNRVNRDVLEPHDSSYVAHHAPDFLFAHDPWFRGLVVKCGPEGGLYVSDWTDTGECHNYDVADTSNGRIYRVVHGAPAPLRRNLAELSDDDLVALQQHANDWLVRHARRLLQERSVNGKLAGTTPDKLLARLRDASAPTPLRLRALWALHAVGRLDLPLAQSELFDQDPYVRGWTAWLAADALPPTATLSQALQRLAQREATPFVRLHLAATAQRWARQQHLANASDLLAPLVARPVDEDDPVLSAMLWYATEPLVDIDVDAVLPLIMTAQQPFLRQSIARKCAIAAVTNHRPLERLFQLCQNNVRAPWKRDVLRGVLAAYAGLRRVEAPQSWLAAYVALKDIADADLREDLRNLAVLFGSDEELQEIRKTLANQATPLPHRQRALELLVAQHPDDLPAVLQAALSDAGLRATAIRGYARLEAPSAAAQLIARYADFSPEERQDCIQTLTARPRFAVALLDAVAAGAIPRSDISALTIRQLQALKYADLDARLKAIWGEIRPAAQAKIELAGKYRAQLQADGAPPADLARGKALYAKTCGQCHKLFGEGGGIGPELTGSQRANLDYILDNVLDPSAIVPFDFQVTILELDDGRVVQGIVSQETEVSLTVQTANEKLVIAKPSIESRNRSRVSMMPEGLFERLSAEELRDLVGYLQSPTGR